MAGRVLLAKRLALLAKRLALGGRRRRIMTTGVPGMALKNSADRQIETHQGAAISNRLHCVLTAGRRETATWWFQGADPTLIKADHPDH